MKNKIGQIALILAVLQVLLVLVSWLVTAAYPDLRIRSLLSGEGTRCFFSHFIDNLTTKFLVWILLGTIAYGALTTSGLLGVIFKSAKLYFHFGKLHYRERIGLRMVLIELFIFIIIAVMLTAFPQAVLLSITGSLFPSSFSEGLYPYVTFAMIVCGLTYGVAAGHIKTTVQAYDTLSSGLVICAKLFPLYILGCELFYSILFVFQL